MIPLVAAPALPPSTVLGFLLTLWLVSPLAAQSTPPAPAPPPPWGQFRGPHGSGVAAPGDQPPVHLNDELTAWKTPIPKGLSSPVIAGQRLFLTGFEAGRLVTLGLDRTTGAVVWRREAPEVPIEAVHETSSPAASTPYADEHRVYVYFGSYGLICYDHEGHEQWTLPLPTPKSLYGMATSPIVHGENLILVLDNDENLDGSQMSRSRIIAVKKSTGHMAWEASRPLVRSGWSTPVLWEHDGHSELVILGSGRVTGCDPDTGEEKWHVTGFSKETIALPVTGSGMVYVSSAQLGGGADEKVDPQPFWEAVMQFDTNADGRLERSEMTGAFTFPLRPELPPTHPGFGLPLPSDPTARKERLDGILGWVDKDKDGFWTKEEFAETTAARQGKPRLMAIRPGGRGDVTTTHAAWEMHRHIPEIPSPLFYENRLYMVRNGGLLAAIDATNGEVIYAERLGRSSGQYSASPVAANGHLYLVSNRGQISVVPATGPFSLIHQHDLNDPVFVTPAIDSSTIYFRSESFLWAFRTRP